VEQCLLQALHVFQQANGIKHLSDLVQLLLGHGGQNELAPLS